MLFENDPEWSRVRRKFSYSIRDADLDQLILRVAGRSALISRLSNNRIGVSLSPESISF